LNNSLKTRILSYDPQKWWGDDFDVRFYALRKLTSIRDKSILDAGGGIGIISSELHDSNYRVNLDINFNELLTCNKKLDKSIQNVNGMMNVLPFNDATFDYVICCHVLDSGKMQDIKEKKVVENHPLRFPTIEKILDEFKRVLKDKGRLIITLPNNAYYKKNALEYDEVKSALERTFPYHSLYFYNIFPKSSSKQKLNLSNIIPKISSKLFGKKFTLDHLLVPDEGKVKFSLSFFIEANKN